MIISQGKLVEMYVFFALHPCTPILWPGMGCGPWLVLWNSLVGQGWPRIRQGELPARALLVTSLELLLAHPDVKMSRCQARSPQWWGVSSIPFQEKYQAPLMRKKKLWFFFSLSPNTCTEQHGGKENSKYSMGNFVFIFFLLEKKIPHTNQNKMEPWSPTCWLEGRERGKGRCLVVCQAFSTGLVALWCGTWSSRGLEPALQMQQELLWKRAS